MGRPADDTGTVDGEDHPVPDTTPSTATARLIHTGRDREAAVEGARPADHLGGPMDPLTQLDALAPLLAGVVADIGADQLDRPTACRDFTVRGVLEHMLTGAAAFAAAYRGAEPAAPDLDDPLGSFGPALADLGAAIAAPGAMARTLASPFGELPGTTFARFVVLDGLVHGWDLATATGQPYDPPADLVAAVDTFAHETLDPLRDGQTFGPAVEPPAGATPIERLVAYTGRNP